MGSTLNPAGCCVKRDPICRREKGKFPGEVVLHAAGRLDAGVPRYHRITSTSPARSSPSHPDGMRTIPSLTTRVLSSPDLPKSG